MHIPRWFIWLFLYAAATFAWIVLFEHGAGEAQYRKGARTEWDRVWNGANDWLNKVRAP